jgi:hypothetical protein
VIQQHLTLLLLVSKGKPPVIKSKPEQTKIFRIIEPFQMKPDEKDKCDNAEDGCSPGMILLKCKYHIACKLKMPTVAPKSNF